MKPAPHGRDRNRRATSGAGTVEVRSSRVHGRGVFAKTDFPARRKLGEVGGHWVALPEARRRVEREDRIYLVELDEHTALDCSEGNAFGRLNHHCSPNCYLRIYRRRVEVYTLRPIRAGQELTVDYGVTPHRNGMACRCGASSCRGRI